MEKKDTAKKAAPKWGTAEWIRAYRFSKMDRKRRARVKKAISGEDFDDLFASGRPHVCCLAKAVDGVMERYGIKLAKKDAEKVSRAFDAIADFEVGLYDEAVGKALARAWKVEM